MNHQHLFETLHLILVVTSCTLVLATSPALASPYDAGKITEESFEAKKTAGDKVYSPYAGRDYPDQVLFGDMHFHTNLSFDAGLIGTSLDAHDGYKVARGEKVISNTGQPVQLIRPLDFLVITDHAEMIGLAPAIQESNPILLNDPWGKWVYERFNSGAEGRMEAFANIIDKGTVQGINPFSSNELTHSIWNDFNQDCGSIQRARTFHRNDRI